MSADSPANLPAPSAAAERMRRYRKRRRLGSRQVKSELEPTEVDALVQMRFLREEDRRDAVFLQTAVMGLIYWVLDDPELMARRRGARSR
jgi:hypothetical protein